MDERIDAAAKALVVLLMTGCDATLSSLAVTSGRPQPAWSPVLVPAQPVGLGRRVAVPPL